MGKRYWFLCFVLMALMFTTVPGFAQSDDNNDKTNDLPKVSDPDEKTNELPKASAPDDKTIDLPKVSDPSIGMPPPIYAKVKELRAEMQKLTKQRKFAEAEKKFAEIKKALGDRTVSNRTRNQLFADVHREEAVRLYSMQGEYQKAANAVRTAIKYDEQKSDMKLLLTTQEKLGLQKDWFGIRQNHENAKIKLLKTKQPLLKEKLAILQQIDTKKRLSDAELKKLQAALKAVNERLSGVNKALSEENRKFAVQRDKFSKKDIVLTDEQQKKLRPLVIQRMNIQVQNYQIHKKITQHLTNIAENTEVTWKDLKENFGQLSKIQEEILALRNRLAVLAKKSPLGERDYAAAKSLRDQLEKAIDKAEELMGSVEKAFIDVKTFSKLTLKEKLEFVKLFRDVWSKDQEFENLKPTLEDLYKKIFEAPIIIDDPLPVPIPTPKPEPVEMISGVGYIINEGNFWLLRFGDQVYYPVNLPAKYRINKLEVKFEGEVVKLIDIEPIKEPKITADAPTSDNTANKDVSDKWWLKYPRISFTHISAPQVADEPYDRGTDTATPSRILEENIDNKDKPASLLSTF